MLYKAENKMIICFRPRTTKGKEVQEIHYVVNILQSTICTKLTQHAYVFWKHTKGSAFGTQK